MVGAAAGGVREPSGVCPGKCPLDTGCSWCGPPPAPRQCPAGIVPPPAGAVPLPGTLFLCVAHQTSPLQKGSGSARSGVLSSGSACASPAGRPPPPVAAVHLAVPPPDAKPQGAAAGAPVPCRPPRAQAGPLWTHRGCHGALGWAGGTSPPVNPGCSGAEQAAGAERGLRPLLRQPRRPPPRASGRSAQPALAHVGASGCGSAPRPPQAGSARPGRRLFTKRARKQAPLGTARVCRRTDTRRRPHVRPLASDSTPATPPPPPPPPQPRVPAVTCTSASSTPTPLTSASATASARAWPRPRAPPLSVFCSWCLPPERPRGDSSAPGGIAERQFPPPYLSPRAAPAAPSSAPSSSLRPGCLAAPSPKYRRNIPSSAHLRRRPPVARLSPERHCCLSATGLPGHARLHRPPWPPRASRIRSERLGPAR